MSMSKLGKVYKMFKREISRNLKYRFERCTGCYINYLDDVCTMNVLLRSRTKSFNEVEVKFNSEGNVLLCRYLDYENFTRRDFGCCNVFDVVMAIKSIPR